MKPPDENSRTRVLCAVFFLSGAAALIFETLWFRRAGLAFGNGVWASAIVLSSFMAGLALGNGLAARYGHRVRRPERVYAVIELIVAAAGILLVVGFSHLNELLAPVFRALLERPVVLNTLRLSIAFVLLMVPAIAMGMTLPLLVKALRGGTGSFGGALGRLYGWNTLGAVAGALAGETLLVEAFGIVGTAFWAGLFNVLAAGGAIAVARSAHETEELAASTPSDALDGRPSPGVRRFLVASFLSGGVLLALEVVWFRFLQLFVPGTTLTFALMLSVVLGGIGLGGLAASRWFRFSPNAHRQASAVALASGVAALLVYLLIDLVIGDRTDARVGRYGLGSFSLGFVLMFPVSVLSGLLFTLIGHAVHERRKDETRAAGLVTLANTLGAALGPLVAGFLLIPWIGMERSFFVLPLIYAAVALLVVDFHWRVSPRRWLEVGLALAFVGVVTAFPFGRMERYIRLASAAYRKDGSEVVAVREGLTETLQYLRNDLLGEPLFYRLVTNAFTMSGTQVANRRYMKVYVYLPVALHPDPRNALLISFGTGSTAKALVDTRSLESIVVVDISREILEMASVVYPEPGENPLEDPRVEAYVEDGRFFLQTTDRRFDLITSEPPPPKIAGVVNLYTREYFQLIHDRLAEGGVATYWLPVVQLDERETKAILRAFLDVFGNETTLWTGSGFNWMLVGTRNARGPVSAEHFARQWNDPIVGPELRALGFERPAQLGATFLMGAEGLRTVTADAAPLTDDRPKRLSTRLESDAVSLSHYTDAMNPEFTRTRFERSEYVRRLWPESLRTDCEEDFLVQEAVNWITLPHRTPGELDFPLLHSVLARTTARTPILWAYGTSVDDLTILDRVDSGVGDGEPVVSYYYAVRAMADRNFAEAERLMAEFQRSQPNPQLTLTRVYLLCLADRFDEARELVEEHDAWFQGNAAAQTFLTWLSDAVGFQQVGS